MSTTLYLQCLSHDRRIISDGEIGHNLSYLPEIRDWFARRVELLNAYNVLTAVDGGYLDLGNTKLRTFLYFLSQHPGCDINIRDEYGCEYPTVTPEEEIDEVKYNTRLGQVKSAEKLINEHWVVVFTHLTDEGYRMFNLWKGAVET